MSLHTMRCTFTVYDFASGQAEVTLDLPVYLTASLEQWLEHCEKTGPQFFHSYPGGGVHWPDVGPRLAPGYFALDAPFIDAASVHLERVSLRPTGD